MSEAGKRILAFDDTEETRIDVPEWGCKVVCRVLSGTARVAVERLIASDKVRYTDLIIPGCFDEETGARLFDETDRDALEQKSGKVLYRLALEVMRLSGLAPTEVELANLFGDPETAAALAVDEGKDGFVAALSNSSATTSPPSSE